MILQMLLDTCYNVYLYVRLIVTANVLIINRPPPIPSEAIDRLLSEADRDNTDPDEIERVFKECRSGSTLMQFSNDDGFNALQLAVIHNNIRLVKLLLDDGFDANHGKCSLPLHLACLLGHKDIVKMLLKHGARVDLEMGMCHPRPHHPISQARSKFYWMDRDVFDCSLKPVPALCYALQNDHLDIVRLLLEPEDKLLYHWPQGKFPLHHACKYGALRCITYLTETYPESINKSDEDGYTPLLLALTWGKEYAMYLIENGADIHALTADQETVLHVLYQKPKNPFELVSTTQFLLAVGAEQDMSVQDKDRQTVLHKLVTHINQNVCRVASQGRVNYNWRDPSVLEERQCAYQKEVLASMELVLTYNCDPNAVDKDGIDALHKMLFLFDMTISNITARGGIDNVHHHDAFSLDMSRLHAAMKILLKNGTDPNTACNNCLGNPCTPMTVLLQSALNLELTLLTHSADGYLQCLKLLCDFGANPNHQLPSQLMSVSLLASLGHKIITHRDILEKGVKTKAATFLNELLALLLKHGLDPNHSTNRCRRHLEGGSGNALVEFVRLSQYIRQPEDLKLVYNWVLTLLQWGANPDIEPYPTEPIICHSQSSIYLKPKGTQAVSHYMYGIQNFSRYFEGGHAEQLLSLFYNSMDHNQLFNCLNSCKFMSRFDPNMMPSSQFTTVLNRLSSEPRSLKQICRVTIYKSLDMQLMQRVDSLPLPNPLKRYLTHVE